MTEHTMEEQLFDEAAPIVSGHGLELVDLRAQVVRDALRVHVVIFSRGGVGVDDCAAVHRMLAPRLEATHPGRDLHLEVSSPGIDRVIRLPREYRIFQSKGIRVYSRARQQWISGIIQDSDDHAVVIARAGNAERIPFVDIQKARLEDSEEV